MANFHTLLFTTLSVCVFLETATTPVKPHHAADDSGSVAQKGLHTELRSKAHTATAFQPYSVTSSGHPETALPYDKVPTLAASNGKPSGRNADVRSHGAVDVNRQDESTEDVSKFVYTTKKTLRVLQKRSREDSFHSRCCYIDVFCVEGCRRPWERQRGRRYAKETVSRKFFRK